MNERILFVKKTKNFLKKKINCLKNCHGIWAKTMGIDRNVYSRKK